MARREAELTSYSSKIGSPEIKVFRQAMRAGVNSFWALIPIIVMGMFFRYVEQVYQYGSTTSIFVVGLVFEMLSQAMAGATVYHKLAATPARIWTRAFECLILSTKALLVYQININEDAKYLSGWIWITRYLALLAVLSLWLTPLIFAKVKLNLVWPNLESDPEALIFSIILIIFSLWVFSYLGLAAIIMLEERRWPWSAIGRNWELTEGRHLTVTLVYGLTLTLGLTIVYGAVHLAGPQAQEALEDIVYLNGFEASWALVNSSIKKWSFLVGFLVRFLFAVVNGALIYELTRVSSRGRGLGVRL
ncbi:MAG: hypothetical protein LBR11_05490 [Deltaproteobacteria bacterium]|jgi:hypothetical protein|nr:hypothetical protein [Deltaproteobacteria bacterium]